ncbi:MAG: glutathione S-transferase N-terminal domain-containing protein [Myxococcota bacterium]
MTKPADLSLYHFDSCPYCRFVRSAARELDLELELRDVLGEPERMRELVEATGRQTVPCLRIALPDGGVRWMHESRDIVAYLKERFAA